VGTNFAVELIWPSYTFDTTALKQILITLNCKTNLSVE